MPTSEINAYTTPEGTSKATTHEDLRNLVKQMMLGDVMRFLSIADRTTVFATLKISPSTGAFSYLIDVGRYERYNGTAWVPAVGGVYITHAELIGGAVSSASATEVLVGSLTWTAVNGWRYKYNANYSWFGTVIGDQQRLRVRYAAGATVTSAGAQVGNESSNDIGVASRYTPGSIERWLPAGLSGQHTVGLFILRPSGTGTVSIEAAPTNQFFHELIAHI